MSPLKISAPVALSTLTQLCNHHHQPPQPFHFSSPLRNSPFFLFEPLTTILFPVTINLAPLI